MLSDESSPKTYSMWRNYGHAPAIDRRFRLHNPTKLPCLRREIVWTITRQLFLPLYLVKIALSWQGDNFLNNWTTITVLAVDVITAAELENKTSDLEKRLLDMQRHLDE